MNAPPPHVVRGEAEIPLELKQGMGPHLQMRWETRGACQLVAEPQLSSRVVTGILGPLELHEGSPASF